MTINNRNLINGGFNNDFKMASDVIENMGTGINETIASYKKDTPDFMAYLHIFEEALQIIYRTISSSK